MVPNGWSKLSLQDLVSINYGKSPKEIIDENGIYDIVGTGGITGSTNSYLHSGPSVIIGRKGTIDKPQFLEKPFWAIDTTFYCLPLDSKKLDMNWFYQLSQVIDWRKYNEASGVPSLSRGTIYSIKVPTPPIQEQQKIVKILTTWDTAIDTTARLIDNSKQQKKALMQQLLTGKKRLLDDNGKPFEGEWEEFKLGDLGSTFNGLTGKTKVDFGSGEKYIPYINIFRNTFIDTDNLDFVNIGADEKQNTVQLGDIFFTTSSETPEEVGMSSVFISDTKENIYLNSFCFGFRLHSLERVSPFFIGYMLRSSEIRRKISVLAQGSTRFNLSKRQLVKITIPLPPIEEQQKIAAVLTNADKEIELLEQQLADLQQEKKALMQVLLTGKVRVVVDGEMS